MKEGIDSEYAQKQLAMLEKPTDTELRSLEGELEQLEHAYELQSKIIDNMGDNGHSHNNRSELLDKIDQKKIEIQRIQSRVREDSSKSSMDVDGSTDKRTTADDSKPELEDEIVQIVEEQMEMEREKQKNVEQKPPRRNHNRRPMALEGHPYNPVRLLLRYNLEKRIPIPYNHPPMMYEGSALPSKPDTLIIMIGNNFAEKKAYSIAKSKIPYKSLWWRIPYTEVHDGIEYRVIPKTPESEYFVRVPDKYTSKTLENVPYYLKERVFMTMKQPTPDYISMKIQPCDEGVDTIKDILLNSNMANYVFTNRDESIDKLNEKNDWKKQDQAVLFKTYSDCALDVRRLFEPLGYVVTDDVYRRQGLVIDFVEPQEFEQIAGEVVRNGFSNNKTPTMIAESVDFPLKSYVIFELNRLRCPPYTNEYISRFRKQLYDRGPMLSEAQTGQLLDAYYWTYLAPEGAPHKENYSDIIDYYRMIGRNPRLKAPHERNGGSVGRCGVQIRRFNEASMAQHRLLKSKHVTKGPCGYEPKKPHPRNKPTTGNNASLEGFLQRKESPRKRKYEIPHAIVSTFNRRVHEKEPKQESAPCRDISNLIDRTEAEDRQPSPKSNLDVQSYEEIVNMLTSPDQIIKQYQKQNSEEEVLVEGVCPENSNEETLDDVDISNDEFVDERTVGLRKAIYESYESGKIKDDQKQRLWNQTIADDPKKRRRKRPKKNIH
jgi:hypothetical protein